MHLQTLNHEETEILNGSIIHKEINNQRLPNIFPKKAEDKMAPLVNNEQQNFSNSYKK